METESRITEYLLYTLITLYVIITLGILLFFMVSTLYNAIILITSMLGLKFLQKRLCNGNRKRRIIDQ